MNIFLNENDLTEIKPLKESQDKGIVVIPGKPNGEFTKTGRPTEEKTRSDIIKELIANDTIELGARESSLIHGVGKTTAESYANGKGITDPEARSRILDAKHDIKNLAVTKLMETLELLSPHAIEKEKDKITVINGLSQVIDRIDGNSKEREGSRAVILQLYNPGTNKEADYDVIEVKGT